MNQNKKVFELKKIAKSFDGEQILKGIDLDIHEKEFVTLLGPSGCGKTTTLRIIGGFVTPDSGDVLFLGKRINDVPPYKRKVNTVFQKYALFPHLAPVIMHLNHGGKIFVIQHGVVQPGFYGNDVSLTRGDVKSEIFSRSRTMFLAVGFAILTAELNDKKLSKRSFKALVFGSQIGKFGFYAQTFLYLNGRAGASNFHSIGLQSTFSMRCLLFPLHVIQNSFLYQLLTSKTVYNIGKRSMDRLTKRALKKLHD